MTAKSRTTSPTHAPEPALASALATLAVVGDLLKAVPDAAFFVKDRAGRYVLGNQSLADRCGFRSPSELVGRHVRDIFPAELGQRYATQDEQVLGTGRPVIDHLELHWYSRRRPGWCLTTKLPLRDEAGNVIGLMGISRDLRELRDTAGTPSGLAAALKHLDEAYASTLSPADLARRAALPPPRFARLIKRIFRLTPSQLISQRRLAAASRLLAEGDQSVAGVAVACGFYDHSAFTRAFRAATGLTPTAFRATRRRARGGRTD